MKSMFVIFGGALAIYLGIVMLIAVWPAIDLSQTPPGPGVEPLTALQDEGRTVYAANGCSYCHTQQVRPLPLDSVFGRPSAPGDFAYQTPELLGSERTGPDLTDVGNRQGEIWQYIHLYDPRAVVPQSIMPDFKFLFRVVDTMPEGETAVPLPPKFAPQHGKVIPTHKAKALVAYLMSLKQTKIPSHKMNGSMGGPTKHVPGPAATAAIASEAPAKESAPASAGGYHFDPSKGKALYGSHCAACHQASGMGLPGAFPPLKGNAAVLAEDPALHLDTILHGAHGKTIDGVKYGGAMPPFGTRLSDAEVADIANHERTSWGNNAKTVTPADVAAVRAGTK